MKIEEEKSFLEFLKNNYSDRFERLKIDIYQKNWFYKLFYNKFSTAEYILKYVQKKYKKTFSLQTSIEYFYEDEIENFKKIQNKSYKKDFLNFLIENNILKDLFYVKEEKGITFIGNYCESLKRKIKKEPELETGIIFGTSYFNGRESDYETLIEIVTIDEYLVPAYQFLKIRTGVYFLSRNKDKDKQYYKKENHYDSNGYGTHYM